MFPAVAVDPDAIFVTDGKFHTSAGGTASIDLALSLVESDLGRSTALASARQLVVYLRRPGGQAQFSGHLLVDIEGCTSDRLSTLLRWMIDHLDQDLSVERLASRAAMSPRNFARRFRAETGVTPAQYVQRLRLDVARRLLTEGDSIDRSDSRAMRLRRSRNDAPCLSATSSSGAPAVQGTLQALRTISRAAGFWG
jgi:transcriptional regulator GlxA family with amidase domain